MRHIVYSVAFLLLLCTFPTVRAGEIHFLPEPQQVKLSGEQFDMKRVRLVSCSATGSMGDRSGRDCR